MKTILKVSVGLLAVCALVAPAYGEMVSTTCGWEDPLYVGPVILGSYGNLVNPVRQTQPPGQVRTGTYSAQFTEAPHSSTPQAYLAFIERLRDGDTIDAGFWGYDVTPGASPSLRIWAAYATTGDITDYQGSADGNSTYTDGTGWSEVTHSWTFDSDGGSRDALVVQARLYSTPSTDPNGSTDFWVDDLWVNVTAADWPATSITTPCGTIPEPATVAFLGMGALALIRRRR